MLTPFTALLPVTSDIEHAVLERAAKALRVEPGRYQSVEGIEYRRAGPSLFRWEIEFDSSRVIGLLGLFPLDRLVPHESTTSAAEHRPQHPVQIRPVMALIEAPLPTLEAAGETIEFHGEHRHSVTPVTGEVDYDGTAVIADGHHRVAAALREGRDPHIMTMLVSTNDATLGAGAFHRVFPATVSLPEDLPGTRLHTEDANTALAEGRIAIVTKDGTRGIQILDPDPGYTGIPAGLLAHHIMPVLGLDESDAKYVADPERATESVRDGGTACLLPEPSVDAIVAAARAGISLPPKATRFRPKPIRGLLMRPLAG